MGAITKANGYIRRLCVVCGKAGFDIDNPNAGDWDGIVYRWNIDGSNNVKIVPPTHAEDSQVGENLAVDKTSGKFCRRW